MAKLKNFSRTINGEKYRIKYLSPDKLEKLLKNCDGACDSPTTPNRTIYINDELSELDELITLQHELQHFNDWSLSEKKVTKMARNIGKCLWELGYRKIK